MLTKYPDYLKSLICFSTLIKPDDALRLEIDKISVLKQVLIHIRIAPTNQKPQLITKYIILFSNRIV